jgi:pilus assembly protein CpaB
VPNLVRRVGLSLLAVSIAALLVPSSGDRAVVTARRPLAPGGTGAGLEVKIAPEKRAMSFRINDGSGTAALIQPNSRVDILVVMDGGERGRVARLFMENMRVLAIRPVPRSPDGQPINAAVATVEVTRDEGERLAIAAAQGQLQLLLRGYGEPAAPKAWRYAPPLPRQRVVP